jgi:hypothetical protein
MGVTEKSCSLVLSIEILCIAVPLQFLILAGK